LIGAAEKAGAKFVVYGPLSSETVDLIVKIFTQKTGVMVEILARRGKGSPQSHRRSGQTESERCGRAKSPTVGEEKRRILGGCS